MPKMIRFVAAALLCFSGVARLHADVVRLTVEKREPFTDEGVAYEKLTGRFFGELDPRHPLNAIITDIEHAPRNARGLVEYSATFTILKPVDMSKGTGVLVYQVPNRGRANIEGGGYFADFRARGHVLVASGWQADIQPGPGIESMVTPIAKYADGTSITGPVMARIADAPAGCQHAADHPRPRDRHGHAGELRYVEGHADATDVRGRQSCTAPRRRVGLRRLHEDAVPRHSPTARRCA